jgi:hypothetical protein
VLARVQAGCSGSEAWPKSNIAEGARRREPDRGNNRAVYPIERLMERDELIAKMRARVVRCRQLADGTTDLRTAKILRSMADEGDADIVRLLEDSNRL